ncbi:hypothetical protein Tco_0967200 [Tanacetum coccineum]
MVIYNPSLQSWLSSSPLLLSHPDAYAGSVSGVPGDRSLVYTHDHDGSESPDEFPDLILSSEPKPLGKHRPPPPHPYCLLESHPIPHK